MSNVFWVERGGVDVATMMLSNSRMAALMEILVVAASAIAKTEHEKRVVAYLADRGDQAVHGRGCVAFPRNALPVGDVGLEQTRGFLLRAFDAASSPDWASLGWKPDQEAIAEQQRELARMRALLLEVHEGELQPELAWKPPEHYSVCPIHKAVRHSHGCIVCGQ